MADCGAAEPDTSAGVGDPSYSGGLPGVDGKYTKANSKGDMIVDPKLSAKIYLSWAKDIVLLLEA